MNVSKSLASAVAAMAVVGSIGFAYAQQTSESGPSPMQSTDQSNPQSLDQSNRSLSSPSDTSSMPASSTDNSTLSNELAPQADRG